MSRGSAAKSSSGRTSIRAGVFAVPISRASFSGDIVVKEDMACALAKETGRDTWACRLTGGSLNTLAAYYSETDADCQCANGRASLLAKPHLDGTAAM